jgi:hypothetical protein
MAGVSPGGAQGSARGRWFPQTQWAQHVGTGSAPIKGWRPSALPQQHHEGWQTASPATMVRAGTVRERYLLIGRLSSARAPLPAKLQPSPGLLAPVLALAYGRASNEASPALLAGAKRGSSASGDRFALTARPFAGIGGGFSVGPSLGS